MISCNVTAQALEAGVHSGQGGGVAPETFSMLRVLLDRLDDAKTGQMKHFHAKVPPQKVGVGVGLGVFKKQLLQCKRSKAVVTLHLCVKGCGGKGFGPGVWWGDARTLSVSNRGQASREQAQL
jgi:hypothetical protein